eukprot:scaffold1621_cov350-Prasinococcus_capsulatus_cf.AAC.9
MSYWCTVTYASAYTGSEKPLGALVGGAGRARRALEVVGHLVLQLQLGHALARLEVVEVDQVVALRDLLRLRLLTLRQLALLLVVDHRGEGGSAVAKPDARQLGRGLGEHLDAERDTLRRVVVDGVRQQGRLAQPQQAHKHQQHLRGDAVGRRIALAAELVEAQRQLGQRGADHRPQEEVARQQQRSQVRRRGTAHTGHHLLHRSALGGVRPVRQHRRAHLGRCHRHLRSEAGATIAAGAAGLIAVGHLRLVEGQLPEGGLDRGERRHHRLRGGAVLPHDPERAPAHARGTDLVEAVQQALQDGVLQPWVGLHNLTHEEDDVQRRGGVGVAEKVHQHVHHRGGHVGKLDGAGVDGLHQQLAVLAAALLLGRGLDHLLLERHDHLLNIARSDEVQHDVERLAADVQAVEYDQLDVVVTLGGQQLAVAVGRGADGGGRVGERHERGGALVHHRGGGGAHEREDYLDVLALLGWVGAAQLADELQHHHLQDVAPGADLVQIRQHVVEGTLLSALEEHQEGITPSAQVGLVLQELLNLLGRVLEEDVAAG